MSVYIAAERLPFVIEVTDADLDEVASLVREWVTDGAIQTFHLADLARYIVQFAELDVVNVTTVSLDDVRASPGDPDGFKPTVSIQINKGLDF